jgi:menaquinol-cytochrome c reductase iron-sulfur subunit
MATTGNGRRRFLSFATKLLLAVLALGLAVPALGYVWAPLRRKRGGKGPGAEFRDLGPLANLPVGEWQLLLLEIESENGWERTSTKHGVWVRRAAGGGQDVTVLSPVCPHLGCSIRWHPDQAEFLCPCHKGVFDSDGKRIGGPPPRGLDTLEWQVRDGQLWVRWQEFKPGVAEQVPVSD